MGPGKYYQRWFAAVRATHPKPNRPFRNLRTSKSVDRRFRTIHKVCHFSHFEALEMPKGWSEKGANTLEFLKKK